MAKLHFWGATGTVTGSKYFLEAGPKLDDRLLVDCGLFQGLKDHRLRNWAPLPEEAVTIGSIALTHAHIDHTGYLPRMVKEGFAGPVRCTSATADLLDTLLPDAGYLQEEEAEFANRKKYSKHAPALPLFTQADSMAALKQVRPQPVDEDIRVSDGLTIRYQPIGHILGAACLRVTVSRNGERVSVLFSGDVGRFGAPLLSDPGAPPLADILVVESTYGDRLHGTTDPLDALEIVINESRERGGVLVIPSFAVGRAQALLYDIRRLEDDKRIKPLPVYLDSPMASKVTRIQERHLDFLDAEARELQSQGKGFLLPQKVQLVGSARESKELNAIRRDAIIISASGMMTGGRILHHAFQRLPHERNTFLFVGFQGHGTRGRTIIEGNETVKMFGELVPVRAKIEQISGYSGHADQDELMSWLRMFPRPPRQVYITHGEPAASKALAARIRQELRWTVAIPEYLDQVELT